MGSPIRAQRAHEFDPGKLRDLIDAEFSSINPAWRLRWQADGTVTGVTYSVIRIGGMFENCLQGAGDRESEYLAAMRRAIDEYARDCGGDDDAT